MFGLNYIMEFIFIVLQYTLDKAVSIPYYDYNLEELSSLKNGYVIHFIFFVLFFLSALFLRMANRTDEGNDFKIKRTLGLFIFVISSMSLFASANNYSEYNRQLTLSQSIDQIEVAEIDTDYIINDKIVLNDIFNNGLNYNKKNNQVERIDTDSIIEIKKINVKEIIEYQDLIKKRYSYNLRELKSVESKFKNHKAQVVEYFTNKDYNRDYVIRIDEDVFVIHFKSIGSKDKIQINAYKNFLVYSVHFKEDKK